MSGLLLLAVAGLGIYAIRASFVVAGERVRLGPGTRAALGHARAPLVAALLTGLIAQRPAAGLPVDPVAVAVVAVAALAVRRGGTASAVLAGLATIAALGTLT
ncbi:MAG: hypothetical protein ACLGG9_09505 [Thermoleophilia bacterium]